MLARLRESLRRWHARRSPIEIRLSDDGFTVARGRDSVYVPWSDICEVAAFKRDLYVVDTICLAVRAREVALEVDEEMTGYAEFEAALHEQLGISTAWKLDVMLPAFATNLTRIYPGTPRRLDEKEQAA